MTAVSKQDARHIGAGYHPDPARSMSLRAAAYTDPTWLDVEQRAIFGRTWQWLCHVEQLRAPGNYIAATVAGMPIAAVRDRSGRLRAFYNVCKHRAHELMTGAGTTATIVCPYHAWVYDLDGTLRSARYTNQLPGFDTSRICLDRIQVEEFCGFVYVNLDPGARPLAEQAPDLAAEITRWAPDVPDLTFARRLTYDIRSNWKNVIDNFLECYHCHIAHPEFVALIDMATYQVRTHGIWSSHFARASTHPNPAYDVSTATVTQHAVWWLWPNTCLLRYPGRGNFMVLQVIPAGPDRSLETWDFFFETDRLDPAEAEAVRYIDDVLQQQDIAIVESVQRGMATPAFDQGRIVYDPQRPGLSEHGVHHFHGLVLDAYENALRHDSDAHRQSGQTGQDGAGTVANP
ncbi:MAG TPA: ring-hydroxylating oxygenase subunit alpha [Rugosimonospora sp.]|nr:ring-hydroxylating oxygenase subunit alpha [Rugosimonospora sp.]